MSELKKAAKPSRPCPRSLLIIIVMLVVFSAACSVNRRGLLWEGHTVEPYNVCPGDFVTVSWNTGESRGGCLTGCSFLGCGSCPDPMRVTVSSSPELFASYETFEQHGSTSAGPVMTDTTFTFHLQDNDDDIGTGRDLVHVVLPEMESIVSGTFEGACYDAAAGWAPLDLTSGLFRSELVRLVKVCNLNTFPVDLILTFETGSEHYTLLPSECTREYEASVGFKALTAEARPLDPSLIMAAECSATRSHPPTDFDLAFFLICDSGSASEAIVMEEPEPTQTPIELIWDPPTSTPDTAPGLPIATFLRNANCRYGPGTVYDVVTSLLEGQEVVIEGQNNSTPKWWWILLPGSSAHCWVSDSTVQVAGPATEVEVIAAPPTPTPSPTPEEGCWHQGPNDNQPLCYVPCPPNPNPGGTCTP